MEIWKDIKGYEGYYQISSHGRVRNTKTNKILTGDVNNIGYKRIILYSPIKQRYFIHRLVAEHFCDGYQENLVVNHIDGNKQNNKAENLEWVTHSQNDLHAFKTKLRKVQGAAAIQTIKKNRKVYMYDLQSNLIKIFSDVDEIATLYNKNREYIQQCCRGLYTFQYKYKLSYIELT